MTVSPSKTLERYQLVDRIAVGGMAEVYRAVAYGAHGFEKPLAIKRILPELASDPEFEARFIGEAKLAVKLTHANVVQVFDFGRFGGTLFIAMEYVDGLDLAALLKATGERKERIPISAAFQIAIDIARGLDFAHSHEVVHRDVSPSNILLSRAGEVKIADFGIAQAATRHRAERPGGRRRIMGKWRYMSPEQTAGEPLSIESDVFSAAAVMFELFTGDKLFPGDEAEEIIENIHNMPIPRASERRTGLPPRLDEILDQALERDPHKRLGKLGVMVRALTEVSYESSIVATALDVAETVARAVTDKKPKPAAASKGIDDLIRHQLGGAAAAAAAAPHRRTAVDAEPITGEEPSHHTDLATLDGDDSGTTGSTTMVRRGVDADGLTLLELEQAEDTIAAVPSAIRFGRQSGGHAAIEGQTPTPPPAERRSRWPLALAAAGLVALGLAGGGWFLWGRGGAMPVPIATGRDAGATAVREATLSIDSVPRGAEIWLDGTKLPAMTPTVAPVSANTPHRIELVAAGHRPYLMDGITVRPGETFPIQPTLQPLQATLRVISDPPDAKVKLGDEPIGSTPLERTDLTPAYQVELTVQKAGYQPAKETIDLDPIEPTELSVVLHPAVRKGKISLYIDGGWANVYLGDKLVGRAPHKEITLPVGKHRLRLHNPHSDKQQFLDVVVDEKKVNYYRVEW